MENVLIVDDVEADRELAAIYLRDDEELQLSFAIDGVDALEKLARRQPDLVVTDMRMPRMDGLELLQKIRDHYPDLPVILVTAEGSEAIAHEALLSGASHYVPKSHLDQYLLPTVLDVLRLGIPQHHDHRISENVDQEATTFRMANDPTLIPPLVDRLQQLLTDQTGCSPTRRLRIAVALKEAITNAVYHGNLEIGASLPGTLHAGHTLFPPILLVDPRRTTPPFCDRHLHVSVAISSSEARFTVSDEGPGFDPALVPDPRDPQLLSVPGSRGLVLMQMFMDELFFNGKGNVVTMVASLAAAADETKSSARFHPEAGEFFSMDYDGDTLIVLLQRSLVSMTEPGVQRELGVVMGEFRRRRLKHVVIDFAPVEVFGASILTALVLVRQTVKEQSGRTAMCNLSPTGKSVVEITRFSDLWPMFDSRNEAVAAVNGNA